MPSTLPSVAAAEMQLILDASDSVIAVSGPGFRFSTPDDYRTIHFTELGGFVSSHTQVRSARSGRVWTEHFRVSTVRGTPVLDLRASTDDIAWQAAADERGFDVTFGLSEATRPALSIIGDGPLDFAWKAFEATGRAARSRARSRGSGSRRGRSGEEGWYEITEVTAKVKYGADDSWITSGRIDDSWDDHGNRRRTVTREPVDLHLKARWTRGRSERSRSRSAFGWRRRST